MLTPKAGGSRFADDWSNTPSKHVEFSVRVVRIGRYRHSY